MYLYLKFSIEWVLKYMLMCLCFAVLLLTLGRRVTVVVLCVIHSSFTHSVTWNCVHFYATTKARTRSLRENILI